MIPEAAYDELAAALIVEAQRLEREAGEGDEDREAAQRDHGAKVTA